MNLNQVTLPVNDIPKATEFYRRMGFLQIVDSPHYARFECPVSSDIVAPSTFSLMLEPDTNGSGATIYFEHEALDEWVDELIEKGFEFEQLPTDMSYLWREAILYDPSGNKIKLYWAGENRLNPPWRVEIS
ncbi:VOC family protein [Kangiella koreensis]|uniref:Glyoxalase/bleomycin resistance protein/dioxygenase n=1 Tax=Kangiella koreensis (strain DSM 16069 / JCM 12317 / KCTC 12182 / SW-125) TaxID=523791 RepID=C7RCZ2_KANKD|nr:VOC family protein [Kangiella koreensis]ACV27134.1 Glyoxalase/bleomycin resistance protein/dioxygenase [Kangiella koreensis DSM 16069]